MRVWLIVACLLIPIIVRAGDRSAPSRPVEFFAEEITLAVDDSTATVTGIYHFRNNTLRPGSYPVMFPFYVDSLSSFPDEVSGRAIEPDTQALEIVLREERGGAIIRIPLSPAAVTSWQLTYRQMIRGKSARYVLVSTQAWGAPLQDATYHFVAPESFANIAVWPKPDSVTHNAGLIEYWSHESNFMPNRDMEINWSPDE
jgi:hypothetical protein